jgi:hypothetical protein
MAAGRRRRWIAIGGALAAVAVGGLATVALGAPTGLSAPAFTHAAPVISWSDNASGDSPTYDVERADGMCAGTPNFGLPSPATSPFTDTPRPADGIYCYRVTGHGYATPPADASALTQVMVDATAPTAPQFSPAIPPLVHGPISLNASSTDPGGSGVTRTTISINGAQVASGATSATYPWNTAGGVDGLYTVTAVSVDAAGNASPSQTMLVAVDNTAPAVPAVTAAQNPVAGKPTLLWQNNPGETYTVSRNNVPQGTGTSPWPEQAALAPGTYDYSVVARDAVGNVSMPGHVSVIVTSPSVTAPRNFSASSPTNVVPHLTWQPPVTFAVTSWQVYRDGAPLATIGDPAANSFDDATLTAQGPHSYAVRALSGSTPGDFSSTVFATYDATAPVLGAAAAVANPDGSVSVTWPDAADPSPGSGVARYVVQRLTGASPPSEPSAGTNVCTLVPPANGCVDSATKNNTLYSYGIFAIDAANNVASRSASARAVDSQAPDPVAGLKIVSSDRTYARLGWAIPGLKGADSDLAGYRVLQLSTVDKPPLNPNDGRVVCRNDDPKDNVCDVLNLVTGKKVSFAVYAYDGVPNYSAPEIVTVTPH